MAATGRRHGITSDARARFERGVDPASASTAIETATQMILDLCGGEASEPRISHAGEIDELFRPFHLVHRPQRVRELAGLDIDPKEQLAILGRLEFLATDPDDPESWSSEDERLAFREKLQAAGDGAWIVLVPSWRPDVEGQADLVEEIARIHGYDKVPSTPLDREAGVAHATATRAQLIERRVRRTAAARGLDEAVTWSFISEKEAEPFGGGDWRLANPISEDLKVMRPSLVPGLIAAAQRNINRGASSIRLFEIGRRYLGDAEHATISFLLAGDRTPRDWQSGKATDFSAFDAKAEALALLEAAGAPTANLQIFPDAGPTWHPGRSATLRLGPKTIVAAFGELHPRLVADHDVPGGAVAAEIYLDSIPPQRSSGRARAAYSPPALQSVVRDFAFVVPVDLTADSLVRAIRGADKNSITAVRLFDRYQPKDGDLSLALEVTLQPGEKSFTEAEIAEISTRIVAAAEKLGAKLRT